MQPPPLPQQIDVLQHVLDRVAVAAADGGPCPRVVFSLDGTLFDNRTRTLQILLEYAEEVSDDEEAGEEDLETVACLQSLSIDRIHYLLSRTLAEVDIRHAEVVRDVTSYWRERFYSNEYIPFDEPVHGAVEYVRALHDAGAGIVYVTGRDIPGMLLGTVSALRDHGFPIAEAGVELVLKPDATLSDEAFKRDAFRRVAGHGEVMGFFDSRSNICEIAQRCFEGTDLGMVDTWQEAPEHEAKVHLVRDFRII